MTTVPPTRTISIPPGAMVVLISAAGCGKSTFARRHFRASEILSSDAFREMVADEEADQSATPDAFELLHLALRMRLSRGLLTVVDATNTRPAAREPLLAIARETGAEAVAVVLNVDPEVCIERNRARTHRQVPPDAIRLHAEELRASMPLLESEGFARVHVLDTGEIDALRELVREPGEGAGPSPAVS